MAKENHYRDIGENAIEMLETLTPQPQHHYHFVTGKLAQSMLREIVETMARQYGFCYSIDVLPITVAALISAPWLVKRMHVPNHATHIIVPGYLQSGLEQLRDHYEIPVVLGPKDCRTLPELFGSAREPDALDKYSIEIIAEINHVASLSIDRVVEIACRWRSDGADVIDIGCDPGSRCQHISQYVQALVLQGHRVSIDSFDAWEVEQAIAAGASLVLSVNSTNRKLAKLWGVEVVVIPDSPGDEASLAESVKYLSDEGVPFRIDPILEPIGTGFARSLNRYCTVRERYPEARMMMGIGNLTELTDVDSAGINMTLMAICQELRIESVLTTEVINWARSSVKECDAARRMCYYAVSHQVPPKRLSDDLVMLRDPRLTAFKGDTFDELAASIKDNNYRLFADADGIHLVSREMHLSDTDPFALFAQLSQQPISENVDPSHAFYLGYEMAKASIARTLGKQYTQDEALRWGMLTREEHHHRLVRSGRSTR